MTSETLFVTSEYNENERLLSNLTGSERIRNSGHFTLSFHGGRQKMHQNQKRARETRSS